MSDKPLAEQMRENEKYVGGACADMVEAFARERLKPLTEYNNDFLDAAERELVLATINTQRRRIRELLVGKETK